MQRIPQLLPWRSLRQIRYGDRSLCARWSFSTSPRRRQEEISSIAPGVLIDTKSIRLDPNSFSRNCEIRNCGHLKEYPHRIARAHEQWVKGEKAALEDRKQLKIARAELSIANAVHKEEFLQKVRQLQESLDLREVGQAKYKEEIGQLSGELPNLTSEQTPITKEPDTVEIHEPPSSHRDEPRRDHVQIGIDFGLLNFAASAETSGWGFYFLENEADDLEHALVQYARSVAKRHGFKTTSPPSIIYSDVGSRCGFRPRDRNGEQQVYALQQSAGDAEKRKPSLSLAGTAEIPFAASKAHKIFDCAQLPQRIVGSSRCYRAEAGARGREARGLYRVHEFTKVEMFAWTMPGQETQMFEEMIAVQKQIVQSLGLYFRRLEMPASDLGASAYRKQDIEVFFPSRKDQNSGWGEVTSTSICTDYQTRRLNTRVKLRQEAKLAFPSTVNGTAMAVPRVLAAILENGWRDEGTIAIPEVLWPWMDGQQIISRR